MGEGFVSWPQLLFAATLIISSFGVAAWIMLRLTEILVRMEKLATRQDVSIVKKDLYERMDRQWNSWMEAHASLIERVTRLEIRLGPNGSIKPPQQ